jgi:hypothetical protein
MKKMEGKTMDIVAENREMGMPAAEKSLAVRCGGAL